MTMPGRKYTAGSVYRYGFNGKENDNEVKGGGNQIDYGERIYDPRLGRFYSVDPMFKDFPELTTYQYGSNNPIFNIDLDGLEGVSGAEKAVEQGGKTILRVATKYGIEQGAKVIAMKAAEKVVESPGFWKQVGTWGLRIGSKALGVIGGVLSPANGHQPYRTWEVAPSGFTLGPGNTLIPNPQPAPNLTTLPNPNPNNEDGDNNKPKTFYVTYTKTKVNADGTVTTYSGRSSGTYTGITPTPQDEQAAVDRRERTHTILNKEGYGRASIDRSSTSYAVIRGREQQLIDYNGGAQSEGGHSRNKIRGVGRKNILKNLYNAAATAAFGNLPNNNPTDKKTP